jgi:ribosomal protein L37E
MKGFCNYIRITGEVCEHPCFGDKCRRHKNKISHVICPSCGKNFHRVNRLRCQKCCLRDNQKKYYQNKKNSGKIPSLGTSTSCRLGAEPQGGTPKNALVKSSMDGNLHDSHPLDA